MESTEMISPESFSARTRASSDLPTAVGPARSRQGGKGLCMLLGEDRNRNQPGFPFPVLPRMLRGKTGKERCIFRNVTKDGASLALGYSRGVAPRTSDGSHASPGSGSAPSFNHNSGSGINLVSSRAWQQPQEN